MTLFPSSLSAGISICIPTFERPDLLAQTLESCIRQTYRPFEIIVSDDSSDDASEIVTNTVRTRSPIAITYRRNSEPLGQNKNVATLFCLATQPRLLLLHDDDLLLPNALATLAAPWQRFAGLKMTFGRQEIVDSTGIEDATATTAHNKSHHRTSSEAGLIADSLRAALLLQIPNDGFLIDASIARHVSYRSYDDVGVYCDKDFSLRLGRYLAESQMYFIDEAVSQYRVGQTSISSSTKSRKIEHPRAAILVYESLQALDIPKRLEHEKIFLVKHLIDKLVKGYALSRQRSKAATLYLSKQYGWRRRLSGRGLYHVY